MKYNLTKKQIKMLIENKALITAGGRKYQAGSRVKEVLIKHINAGTLIRAVLNTKTGFKVYIKREG